MLCKLEENQIYAKVNLGASYESSPIVTLKRVRWLNKCPNCKPIVGAGSTRQWETSRRYHPFNDEKVKGYSQL